MPTAFKDYISPELINDIGIRLNKIAPSIDPQLFEDRVFSNDWLNLELKERMTRISGSIFEEVDGDYLGGLDILLQLTKELLESGQKIQGIEYLFIPDYIGRFGTDHINESLSAMKEVTKLVSCEFAIRPFIAENAVRSFKEIYLWANDPDENVRRLASEGCRPRLPWGMQLKDLIKNPEPVLPVLESLRRDPSMYVRKSVANNLNDISKDHPDLVLKLAKKWKGESAETDWIIKHGLRTLLKASNTKALELIGYASANSVRLSGFTVNADRVESGDAVEFEFELKQTASGTLTHRIEYAIYFLLSNGSHYRKVFKISERSLDRKKPESFTRKHSFRKITTRTYYPGRHYVSLIINGKESEKKPFILIQ